MIDSVQGMREIVAFNQEPSRLKEIADNQREYGQQRLRFFKQLTLQRTLIEGSIGLGGITVLGLGAYFVSQGNLAATLLPLLSLIALSSFLPVSEVVQTGKQLADTLACSRRIFSVHDEPVTVLDGPGVPGSLNPSPGSSLRFEHVNFSYGEQLPQALKDVNFPVEPGQTVAVVGRSGAGKTTSAHLLLRFWDPDSGSIYLNDQDLKQYQVDELRRSIALVSQDTYLFNTTIKENLKIAKPEASDVEIITAAKKANAHEFIASMPSQYETNVGERGVQLSGGQSQRIAIALSLIHI